MRPAFNSRQSRVESIGREGALRRHKPDYWLLVLTALLLGIGLVVVYSISPALAASQHISQNYFITKQLIAVGLGTAAFIVAYNAPIKTWLRASVPLLMVAAICSVAVMLSPVDVVHDAHRWIRLGGFSFQAVEVIKLAVLVWLAAFLARQWQAGRLADSKATLQPLVILLVILAIVVAKMQSDLGSAGVVIAMMLIMAYAAGVPLRKIALFAGVIVVVAVLAIASSSYRRERLATYFHPQSNCLTTGYQACQSLISVGSGGVFGLGLGYSVQAYGYQPEAANDSIFAIMAEKFGFVGTFAIIAVYGVFLTRLKQIVTRTADQFSRLLVVGVMAWISTQMLINIGAMIGLLPLKGITLPLISQGGTSLVFLTAALGLVFQVSRYTSYNATEPSYSIAESSPAGSAFNRRRVGRPHNTPLVARPRA
jgi:cell division protein FtsW